MRRKKIPIDFNEFKYQNQKFDLWYFSLDTLTRMTKMQKFIPAAKRLDDIQDQAEMVRDDSRSLKIQYIYAVTYNLKWKHYHHYSHTRTAQ